LGEDWFRRRAAFARRCCAQLDPLRSAELEHLVDRVAKSRGRESLIAVGADVARWSCPIDRATRV
jgi:hypothetical protein